MLSLYRRHRPKTFDQVVGQDHIVRTLRNAIELDKVHHAYLFVGSRGTGKTSMAKLLACALNAEGGARVDFDPGSEHSRAILGPRSLWWRWTRLHNSGDDIRGCARTLRSPRCGRAACTSSTRRTCSPPRPGTRSSRRWRSRHRTWSSCWPPPRRTRCRPRSSTAATASTSSARRWSRSPGCCAGWPARRASSCPTPRWACSPALPPARFATRSARSSSWSPTGGRR